MALPVYHLRRLLAATAVLFTVVIAGMYFYARMRTRDFRNEVPHRLGFDIKQTANGFQFSKSDGKRTLFTVQASNVKEFKLNGNAELHNVTIILYGRDSSRYDQIYGDDFAYNQKTGDVTAKGEVQIDLVSNPTGENSLDQATPKEIKNPIHLKTRDLVFNKDSGNASTDAAVEFSTPQASGSGVGVKYEGKSNTLILSSQIHIVTTGPDAAVINAEHSEITNDPRVIVLEHPRMDRQESFLSADQATFYLGPENDVQRVVADGQVSTDTKMSPTARANSSSEAPQEMLGRAEHAELFLTEKRNLLRSAILTGNVHIEQTGSQPMQGDAGRVVLDYSGQNVLQKVHALDGARITQESVASGKSGAGSAPQRFEVTAPIIDFTVADGHLLEKAVTSGAAKIQIDSAPDSMAQSKAPRGQRTIVTAGKFEARFTEADGRSRLATVHGAPSAKIVNSNSGEPDRISTSETVDAIFLPQAGGIESVTQQGNVAYSDGQPPEKRTLAWANNGRYTPADQMLVLTGNPRVINSGMETTANAIHINRATGDAIAEGDVKSTYSELKEQPDGALLASSSPIHVTSRSMTAHNNSGIALYSGNARLWQDANIVEAPSIEFDRDRRSVLAQGTLAQPVQTILTQAAKAEGSNQPAPQKNATKIQSAGSGLIVITAAKLTYTDDERKVHYEGGVNAKGDDFTADAQTADAFLVARNQAAGAKSFAGPSRLDHMIAENNVVVRQPNRRADGQKLVYTPADDKFVLTGGTSSELPSIFDAEQGKITGVSLTFYRTDDRVLVEGAKNTPVVTQTRVAR
ncbi:MAG: LPS export ABC transporter periplasmic protein LptC [Candidatus Sulfotelmatobacter sp.]